jgi:hypothetical protein
MTLSVKVLFEPSVRCIFILVCNDVPQLVVHEMSEETAGVPRSNNQRVLCGSNELQPDVVASPYECLVCGFLKKDQESVCLTQVVKRDVS